MPDTMGVNDIAFPHLGIYLENLPKSFSIFGFEIAFYGMIIGIGVILGVLMAERMAKAEGMDTDIIWDFGIYAVIFSIIGARIYYVVFSWDLYRKDLLSIFNLRRGGLAIYGAVIAAFITLFVYAKIKKLSPYQIGDCGVYGLILGQIIGRWGNFFNCPLMQCAPQISQSRSLTAWRSWEMSILFRCIRLFCMRVSGIWQF